MEAHGLTDLVLRAPEEYPKNLGLPRPDFLRLNFENAPVVRQLNLSYETLGRAQLVAFWGVGWRPSLTSVDRKGMCHLSTLVAHLQTNILRGVGLTLLLGDNHGMANEIPDKTIASYLQQVEEMAVEFKIDTIRLSKIYPLTRRKIEGFKLTEDERLLFSSMQKQLEKSARNVCPENHKRRAEKYFMVRYREADALRDAFPLAVLANSDVPQRKILAPDLPCIWICSLPGKRWRKRKPWFIN